MRRIKANSEYECWKTQWSSQHIGECRFCNRISPAVFDFFEAENYVEGKKCVIVRDMSGREYDMEEDSFVVVPARLKKLKNG